MATIQIPSHLTTSDRMDIDTPKRWIFPKIDTTQQYDDPMVIDTPRLWIFQKTGDDPMIIDTPVTPHAEYVFPTPSNANNTLQNHTLIKPNSKAWYEVQCLKQGMSAGEADVEALYMRVRYLRREYKGRQME